MTPPEDRPSTVLARWVRDQRWTVDDFCRHYTRTARSLQVSATEIGERQAKRWLAGTVTRPRPASSKVLEEMTGQRIDELFSHATVAVEPDVYARPAQATSNQIPPFPNPSAYAEQTDSAQALGGLLMAADDAARFLAHAQAADAGPDAVTLLYNEVRRIARAFPIDGSPALLPALTAAQRFAFRALDGPAPPEQTRDLYFLAGVTCGLLAHAGRDLGQIDAAMTQTRTALLCADRAGHTGLRVWLRNEQSSTARWAGWHHEALRYTQLAAADAAAVPTNAAFGRALREARAHAAIGDADNARAALTAAEQARQQAQPDELTDIGGQLTLSRPDGLFVAADALSMLPSPAEAEHAATDAVAAIISAASDVSAGNKEGAHITLALARARQGDVDGTREALRPVLSLPPNQRVFGIVTNLQRVQASLNSSRYAGSPAARDTSAEIEEFSQLPARTRLSD